MKRVLGYMALSLGALLLFIAPLLEFYALPRVEKAPTDVNETVISNGIGKYFSPTAVRLVGPTRLQNIQVVKGDPDASTHSIAVYHSSSTTVDLVADQPIDYDQRTIVFNRRSGTSVNCCGVDPPATGQYIKFPFNISRDVTYQMWNTTANRAFPATYVRDDVLDGLKVWVFVSNVPATRIGTLDFPGGLLGAPGQGLVPADHMYQATTTLWVEPYTGAIVQGGQHAVQWVQKGDQRQELADVVFRQSPASVKSVADRITSKRLQLQLVKFWVPVIGPILGAILVGTGLVLLLRRRRRPASAEAPPVARVATS